MAKYFQDETTHLKLKNGEFSLIPMNLYKWMQSYDYQTLDSLIDGCTINENADLLYIIAAHINKAAQNFNLDKCAVDYLKAVIRNLNDEPVDIDSLSKEDIINIVNEILDKQYSNLMKHLLTVAYQKKENNKRYTEIIEMFAHNPLESFRVYSSYILDNPEELLDDSSNKVRKIAYLRINLTKAIESYSKDEKELIDFLATALKVRAIEIYNGLVPCFDKETNTFRDDYFYAMFNGIIKGDITNFDIDVFELGKLDQSILAVTIYKKLLQNELFFEDGMEPPCYQRIIGSQNKKIKKERMSNLLVWTLNTMKQENFDLDDFGDFDKVYENIDYLEANKIENITGDNLFLAFLQINGVISLNFIACINDKIYNFSSHKYLDDRIEILFARAFSDIMPSEIWRLVHITNYDLISIDIDDDKYYLIDQFEENYMGLIDKKAKAKVLRNGYKTS